MAYNAPGTCSDISLVVKFGGSLYNHVPDLIPILLMSGRSLFIVPGGGPFADRVRVAGIDEESSHWMAIAADDERKGSLTSFLGYNIGFYRRMGCSITKARSCAAQISGRDNEKWDPAGRSQWSDQE